MASNPVFSAKTVANKETEFFRSLSHEQHEQLMKMLSNYAAITIDSRLTEKSGTTEVPVMAYT